MRLTAASLGALKLDTDVTDKIFFDTDVPERRAVRSLYAARRSHCWTIVSNP